MKSYILGLKAMSFSSVEPECITCGGSSCQNQYLSKITAKGKASFKSWIADDTQLVQKFDKFIGGGGGGGAEYAPKNDIFYHRSCKLDRLNNSYSVVCKRDADIS